MFVATDELDPIVQFSCASSPGFFSVEKDTLSSAVILYSQYEQEFVESDCPVHRSLAKSVDNLARLFDAAGQVGIGQVVETIHHSLLLLNHSNAADLITS